MFSLLFFFHYNLSSQLTRCVLTNSISVKHFWYSLLLKFWTSCFRSLRFSLMHKPHTFLHSKLMKSDTRINTKNMHALTYSFFILSASWYCTLSTSSTTKVGYQWFYVYLRFRVVSLFVYMYIFYFLFMIYRFDPQSGLLTGTKDGTLVNLFLRQFGRRSEKSLCILLLAFQVTDVCNFSFWNFWYT